LKLYRGIHHSRQRRNCQELTCCDCYFIETIGVTLAESAVDGVIFS
jgi:hypothetical protein